MLFQSVANADTSSTNQLNNSSFDGFASWSYSLASITTNGKAKIPNGGYVYQDNVSLTSGATYRVSFWTQCDLYKDIDIGIPGFAPTFTVSAEQSWQRQTVQFAATGSTTTGRLGFTVGGGSGSCFLSDPKLEVVIPAVTLTPSVTPSTTPSPTSPATNTPTPTNGPTATPTRTPTATPYPQIFYNNFATGIDPWYTNAQGGASCSASWDAGLGAMMLDVTASGSAQFHCQLEQAPISVLNGRSYRLTYRAKASSARTFGIKFMQNASPFDTYYGETTLNLTTSYQNFTDTWTMTQDDGNAKVSFRGGLTVGQVWVDDVRLEEISAPAPTATPTSPATNTPTPTATPTKTNTPGPSPTPTITPSPTKTNTPGPSPTPTTTPTPSVTPTDIPVSGQWGLLTNGLRNKYQWGFASSHMANTAIGSGAQYYPAGIYNRDGTTAVIQDEELMYIVNTVGMPTVPVYPFVGFGWGSGTNRCARESNNPIDYYPFPQSWVIPDNGENNPFYVLMPDGHTVKQSQPITHCSNGGDLFSKYLHGNIDIYSATDTDGPHGSSSVGGLPLAIKVGELTSGKIHHVMGINLYANHYYQSNCSYTWPAQGVDNYCSGTYGGTNPYLKPGAQIALLPSYNCAGLRTQPGRIICVAFQDYGAIVADDTAWNSWALWTEKNPTTSVATEFYNLYNGTGKPNLGTMRSESQSNPWWLDWRDMMQNMYIISNKSSTNYGGGGTRRQPAPPAIGN